MPFPHWRLGYSRPSVVAGPPVEVSSQKPASAFGNLRHRLELQSQLCFPSCACTSPEAMQFKGRVRPCVKVRVGAELRVHERRDVERVDRPVADHLVVAELRVDGRKCIQRTRIL